MQSIGVGITTYNRRWKLEECLASLRAFTPEAFDLVIADDGSSDGTVEFLRGTDLNFVTGPNRGVAWNKNRALYTLFRRGHDIIVLLEDDAFPSEAGWLTLWADAARRYDHVNYAGPWFPPEVFLRGTGSLEDPYVTSASTAQVSAFSRDAVARVGYFDSRFRGFGHEHVDLTRRIIRDGRGGWHREGPQGEAYEYISLGCGVRPTADASFYNEAEVQANQTVFHAVRDAPLYREPWQTFLERDAMLSEVGAVAAAPSHDVHASEFFRPLKPATLRQALLTVDFGAGSGNEACLGVGWSPPEAGGVWAVDSVSEIRLRLPDDVIVAQPPGYALCLTTTPYGIRQNVSVALNGFDMGRHCIEAGIDTTVLFPSSLVSSNGALRLRLTHPDGGAPGLNMEGGDPRVLSLWLMTLSVYALPWTPPTWGELVDQIEPSILMQSFRSLGDNAEFCAVQNEFGFRIPSLFLHAHMSFSLLLHGLLCSFEGVDDLSELRVSTETLHDGPRDYIVTNPSYNLFVVAEIKEGAMTEDAVRRTVAARLSVLRRLLLDDIAGASRIFVLHRERALEEAEIIPVWTALRMQCRATLLYVTLADDAHPAGTVERRRDGLYCGRIDRLLQSHNISNPSMEIWLTICRRAYTLWREDQREQLPI